VDGEDHNVLAGRDPTLPGNGCAGIGAVTIGVFSAVRSQ
jgi:hypothetical protein